MEELSLTIRLGYIARNLLYLRTSSSCFRMKLTEFGEAIYQINQWKELRGLLS